MPTEAQFEKAARGTDGRTYPWGDEFGANRCNTEESGIGSTSAVGIFSTGASPYGALDLCGNVSEWTNSLWGEDWNEPEFKYPYDPEDGRENLYAGPTVTRVLRGGSWLDDRTYARCALRSWYGPGRWVNSDGFRVVVVTTPLPQRPETAAG